MNWDFVFKNRLAVGQTPADPSDLDTLRINGITHLIDCRAELDIAYLVDGTPWQPNYLYDPTTDWNPLKPEHKPLSWFKTGLDFAMPILRKDGGNIYVFCHEGANRSATMAWAFLRGLGYARWLCFEMIDTHRLIDVVGLLECGWWPDAEAALRTLGYIS